MFPGIVASSVQIETRLRLPGGGVTNSVLSTPDDAGFTMGDFTIEFFGSIDDTTTNDMALISQWTAFESQRSFSVRWANIGGVKQIKVWISLTGATSLSPADGTFPFPLNNGELFGVRATRQSSSGTIKVYGAQVGTVIDPPTWVLKGTGTSSTGTLWNSTKRAMVGAIGGSADDTVTSNHLVGFCRRFVVLNGYEGFGTVICAPDIRIQDHTATSFVDPQGKTWTLTGATDLLPIVKP
jgi:hypothetical protein